MKIGIITDTHHGHNHNTQKRHKSFYEKLSHQNCDLIIHSGDWISNQQSQFEKALRNFRKYIKFTPTVTVLGNHDYWDTSWTKKRVYKPRPTMRKMLEDHRDLMTTYDIRYLQEIPYIDKANKLIILGFDGWYASPDVKSNDTQMTPLDVSGLSFKDYMTQRAYKTLDSILKSAQVFRMDKYYKHFTFTCVTHFNLYQAAFQKDLNMNGDYNYLHPISELFDYLICGHTHLPVDFEYNNCRIVNAGTFYNTNMHGYNNPRYEVIEL
jgi:predicted phosphodiesterase